MKKYQIIIWAACLLVKYSYGQYGAKSYPHNLSVLTSAKKTNINATGFVMAGIYPFASGGGQPDFVIDNTDLNGVISGFSEEYFILADPNCTGNPAPMNGCGMIDIIEVTPVGTENFAIAGLFSGGIFFATLDAAGGTLTTVYWPLPAGTTKQIAICESSTPGDYYICGDYGGQTYVIKIDYTGFSPWSGLYGNTNMIIEAMALIESPYNTNELIVVGRCDPDPASGLAAEAFFLQLDGSNNGNLLGFICYSDGWNGDEWFTSIKPAASTFGGSDGFIVGGDFHSTDPSLLGYAACMMKLDHTGNVIWSSLINHDPGIYDVFERYNPISGTPTYEYFGVAMTPYGSTTENITVWKLDESGGGSISPNTFVYPLGTTVAGGLAQIEFIGNGSFTNDGFAAFGTDRSTNEHVLHKSFYNGVNGCHNQSDMTPINGPGISMYPSLNITGFINPCTDFQLGQLPSGISDNTYCFWTPTPTGGGSNARTSLVTGLEAQGGPENVTVFPNPANKSITVQLKNNEGQVNITLTNSLGQVVKKWETLNEATGRSEMIIDFQELQLGEGLYFVNVSANHETRTHKVMYTK